jgi:hypothetical protein
MKRLALLFVLASFAILGAADLQDASGTITAGGTSQQLVPSNNSPRYFLFQNISSDTLWISNGIAAVQDKPSIRIISGASYEPLGYVPADAWYVIGPTAGAKFVCKFK